MSRSKKQSAVDETIVKYGHAQVHLHPRGDGRIALAWREGGGWKRTTRGDMVAAVDFAEGKARALDEATGKVWIAPSERERLDWLYRLAGGKEHATDFLQAVATAAAALGNWRSLKSAADYFATHGPQAVAEQITLGGAISRIMAEYSTNPKTTTGVLKGTLKNFAKGRENQLLLETTHEQLLEHIRSRSLAPASYINEVRRFTTFFTRCRELELWPEQKPLPSGKLKRPRMPDKAPEIFTVEQGEKLLKVAAERLPAQLPYLLIAGWLGCRPSECVRLVRGHFDLKHQMLHLPHEVVGKTARERWVPIPDRLNALLKSLFAGIKSDRKVCAPRDRLKLSRAALALKIHWPHDVLRHSCITYRLQVSGDIGAVAEESGNSPNIIRSNYRRPIPPGMGKQWFALLEGQFLLQ